MSVLRPTVLLAVTTVLATAAPAVAAPPSNDTFAGAIPITSLPFGATVDTTAATTDADDADALDGCAAPATEASVWYSYTPSTDQAIQFTVWDSDYSAGLIVVTGAPGSFQQVACEPGQVTLDAQAGQTYRVMAFDDTPGAGNGGTLKFSATVAPPTRATFDPVVNVGKGGVATVTGTFTCATGADATLGIELTSSSNGRGGTSGFTGPVAVGPCDGEVHGFSIDVVASKGRFGGGKGIVGVDLDACTGGDCSEDSIGGTIDLKR